MSNFVVDNEELISLADAVDRFKESIAKDVNHLRNESADIFLRYMAYNKLRNMLKGVDLVMNICHKSMIAGHNLQDEFFHTEEGKENGWNEVKKFDHPFFKDEDEKEGDGEKIPEILKNIVAGTVLAAIVSRKSNDTNNDKE